jgi:hypothetical protein
MNYSGAPLTAQAVYKESCGRLGWTREEGRSLPATTKLAAVRSFLSSQFRRRAAGDPCHVHLEMCHWLWIGGAKAATRQGPRIAIANRIRDRLHSTSNTRAGNMGTVGGDDAGPRLPGATFFWRKTAFYSPTEQQRG